MRLKGKIALILVIEHFSDFLVQPQFVITGSRYILGLFFDANEPLYLTMDRTNWRYGQLDINILMLGACYKGRAIPICWLMLNKKGNSNVQERIELLSRFITLFGHHRIKALLADREFIGGPWFNWLKANHIPFNIRIRKNTRIYKKQRDYIHVMDLFSHLAVGHAESLRHPRVIWKESVYLTGIRLSNGELLIIATDAACVNALEIYGKRWEIETLFESLKTRGFNFEETRLIHSERISKMVAILAIAYCWAHKTGEWRCLQGKMIKIKKHGRLEKSLVRHGLDLLQGMLLGAVNNQKLLKKIISLMKPKMMICRLQI